MDCFRPGRGRGLDKATTSRLGYGVDIPRPNRDHFADAESFAGEGVRLVRVKSLRLKAANGGKCAVAKGDKLRQVCCRLLPQFDTGADAARFVGRMVKGMVSSKNCPQMRARQTREIRRDWYVGGCSASVTGAVRVNQGRDGVSPVVASIYCSPHPAALQIDPPPGSGSFASMISRPEN